MDNAKRKGGLVRAEVLSPARRSEIARAAAASRWGNDVPTAIYEGALRIGETDLPVAVLEDGTRVLISRAFLQALGRPWKGTYGHTERPNFIDAKNLDEFISEELESVLSPIEYRNIRGQKVQGFRAQLLPLVCEVYLKARDKGKLTKQQDAVVRQAEMLMRALSRVGIIALVDEATGYEKARARSELQKILAAYIAPELLPWEKRFPSSFYEELHRVRGWRYAPGSNARNAYIGKLTNKLIYEQLPPGVLEELRAKNPVDPVRKRRRRTHHEFLTPDIGHPHLEKQILVVTTLLSISDDWTEFTRVFSRKFPPGPDDLFALPAPEN